jgi:hypothetical protein
LDHPLDSRVEASVATINLDVARHPVTNNPDSGINPDAVGHPAPATNPDSAQVARAAARTKSLQLDEVPTHQTQVVINPDTAAIVTTAPPRLHLFGPRGGRLTVPDCGMCNPGLDCTSHLTSTMHHCACCWEPDDHTMICCRVCNKHLHVRHFDDPAVAEETHNTGEGWVCEECTINGTTRNRGRRATRNPRPNRRR